MHLSPAAAFVLIAACATGIGCGGGSEVPAYSVTGKVTVQGAPLGGYRISFVSAQGVGGASATLDSDGSYSLQTLDGRRGCTLGKYKIVLIPGAEQAQAAMMNMQEGFAEMQKKRQTQPAAAGRNVPLKMSSKIPEAYNSVETSPKEVEVKAVSNVFDIAI